MCVSSGRDARTEPPPTSRWRACLALALLAVAGAAPAGAFEPWVRQLQEPAALAALPVWCLTQDGEGFLWLGTVGQLHRWDGEVLERHAAETLEESPWELRFSADGVLHLRTRETSRLLRLVAGQVEPVSGPDGGPLLRLAAFAFDRSDRLWVAGEIGLWWRAPGGAWRQVLDPRLAGGVARRLRAAADGAMLVATHSEVYRVAPGSGVHLLAQLPPAPNGVQDLLELPDGRLAVLRWWGGLYLAEQGEVRHVAPLAARGISVVLRGDTVWASFASVLAALRPDGSVDLMGQKAGVSSGGPLMVDREGSLWMGTLHGLLQLPEPDTRIWTDRDGLPNDHTRFVSAAGDTVWATTWAGTVAIVAGREGYRLQEPPEAVRRSIGQVCRDQQGDVLAGGADGLLRQRDGAWERLLARGLTILSCTPKEGARWILTTSGLYHVGEASAGRPAIDGPYPFPLGSTEAVILRDRGGRLWLGGPEGEICGATEREVLSRAQDAWDCETLPGVGYLTDLEELADGTLWAASRFAGVLERRGSSWVSLDEGDDSLHPEVTDISPSPRGGVWLTGRTRVMRVLRDPAAANGYRLLEKLIGWHGLPIPGGHEAAEDARGNVWITTSLGVVQVPPEVRDRRPSAPPVALVEARVDDQRLEGLEDLALPFDRNRLELRFAALSFRDPALVRYQVRLAGDAPWSDAGPSGRFRWLDLPPGRYQAAVRASLDGASWSPEPAVFSFRVLPPWYRTLWARTLLAAVLVSALAFAYRLRVAHLVALERQRSRIATDLHDEMGSGLGSIGVLAELLSSPGSPRGDPEDRELARQIAGTAHELGAALGDIVWALDTQRGGTLQEVFARLAERARGLLAGAGTELAVRPPARWPDGNLTAEVRRSVLLVGLEALHNAARHSGARSIELGLAPEDGSWRLTVRDDGRGMPEECELRPGHGVPGMRRRAAEIGGEICWLPTPGGGITTALLFHPRGARRP